MSEKQLDEFASTKRKGKPEHVSKEIATHTNRCFSAFASIEPTC